MRQSHYTPPHHVFQEPLEGNRTLKIDLRGPSSTYAAVALINIKCQSGSQYHS